MICTCRWTQGRLQKSFLKMIFLLLVRLGVEYTKLFVGKVVDSKTRGSCIPTDLVKSGDDYPILFIILRLGHILIRIRPIWHIWLVKIM